LSLTETLVSSSGRSGGTPNGSTQNLYKTCASKTSFYFHAPNENDLASAFETIGRQLSNLRLSK